MSEKGKKTSVYVGDPIQRVKQRLREENSPLTLSARLNQITQRYLDFVVAHPCPDFSKRELAEVRRALNGIDVTTSVIRGLDSLIENDLLAQRIESLMDIERLTLIETMAL